MIKVTLDAVQKMWQVRVECELRDGLAVTSIEDPASTSRTYMAAQNSSSRRSYTSSGFR